MPNILPSAGVRRRIVVVGAGPGGLEAARAAAERGHEVIVHEAAPEAGGQLRLAAQTPRRAEMLGIIDWRLSEAQRLGATFRFNSFADAETVLADSPDVVIVATGGLPFTDNVEGSHFAVSAWDILTGDARPGTDVLIADEAGDYVALQAAEKIAASGGRVEIVARDRAISPEVMGMSLTPAVRELQKADVRFTVTWLPKAIRKDGNALVVDVGSDYGGKGQRRVDQVVINAGTLPLDEIYFNLRPGSSNLGQVDYEALIAGLPQDLTPNPDGSYKLFRIGDAVSSRNVHAAIYDALRLVRNL